MAEETDGILFTGNFDPSAFSEGIDAMIASTKKMAEEEKKLQKELDATTAKLDENKKSLNDLFKEQQKADKTAADYTAKMKALAKQADDLRKKNEELHQTTVKQKAELDAAAKAMKKMEEATKGATKAAEDLNKEGGNIGANVSGAKLFGKLGDIKTKVTESLGGVTKEISGGVKSAIEGVSGALGIFSGAAVAAIIPITLKLIELNKVESDAERQLRLTNESLKSFASGAAQASSDVDVLKIKFDLARQGLLSKKDVLEEYNKTLGTTLGVTKSFNEAEESLIKNADTYIKIVGLKAQAQALANLKIAESEKKVKAELNTEDNRNTITKVADYITANELIPGAEYEKRAAAARARFNVNIVSEADKNIKVISEKEIEIQTALANLLLPFKDNPKKFETQRKAIENIFIRELEKLKNDLAKVTEKTFTNEDTITAAVEAEFSKREAALNAAFKRKQLTGPQLAILKENMDQLQELTLNKDIKDFQEKRAAFLKQIDEAIVSTQLESDRKRIENLQDNFERERKLILFETEKTVIAEEEKRDKLIAKIRKNARANGLSAQQVQELVDIETATAASLIQGVIANENQKLQKLSFDTFQTLKQDTQRMLESGNLGASEGAAIQIKEQTELYLRGEISYKAYQKRLSEIARVEARQRLNNELLNANELLKANAEKLKDSSLTDDQRKTLNDENRRLRQRIADLEKSNETGKAGDEDARLQRQIAQVVQYAQVIGNLTQTVIGFWSQMNQAESAALDRSIALQEKRVEAARRVAERGNAEYLRLEEERMKELEIKRENAARRQLAINAALQASQVITALISGIAQGASVGGPIGALIGLTAIVGAIASGYAIAQSLKPQEPSFFVGTEDTGRGGKEDSKGGFRAILHPRERVLTAEQNKKLGGMSNEDLVKTVQASRFMIEQNRRKIPQLNYAAMDRASNVSSTGSIQLAAIMEENNRKLDENNQLHRRTHHLLKNMGVSVNMDRNGIAVSVLEATEEIIKSKKS